MNWFVQTVVPSQSNQIFGTSLKQFVASIKLPDGTTDGADKFPGEELLCSGVIYRFAEALS